MHYQASKSRDEQTGLKEYTDRMSMQGDEGAAPVPRVSERLACRPVLLGTASDSPVVKMDIMTAIEKVDGMIRMVSTATMKNYCFKRSIPRGESCDEYDEYYDECDEDKQLQQPHPDEIDEIDEFEFTKEAIRQLGDMRRAAVGAPQMRRKIRRAVDGAMEEIGQAYEEWIEGQDFDFKKEVHLVMAATQKEVQQMLHRKRKNGIQNELMDTTSSLKDSYGLLCTTSRITIAGFSCVNVS